MPLAPQTRAWGPCDAELTRQQNERVAKRGAEDRPLRGSRAGKFRDDIGDQKGAAVDQDRDSNRKRGQPWDRKLTQFSGDKNGGHNTSGENRSEDLVAQIAGAAAQDGSEANGCQ